MKYINGRLRKVEGKVQNQIKALLRSLWRSLSDQQFEEGIAQVYSQLAKEGLWPQMPNDWTASTIEAKEAVFYQARILLSSLSRTRYMEFEIRELALWEEFLEKIGV